MSLSTIYTCFFIGITLAISVGPVALLILNNGITHGPKVAVYSALGAASADLLFAIFAFYFSEFWRLALEDYEVAFKYIASTTLILLGLYFVLTRKKPSVEEGKAEQTYGFMSTFLITILNPLTIIVFLAIAATISDHNTPLILMALSLFFGSLLIQLCYALGGVRLGRAFKNTSLVSYSQLVSGMGLCLIGAYKAIV